MVRLLSLQVRHRQETAIQKCFMTCLCQARQHSQWDSTCLQGLDKELLGRLNARGYIAERPGADKVYDFTDPPLVVYQVDYSLAALFPSL